MLFATAGTAGSNDCSVSVTRSGANVWWIAFGDAQLAPAMETTAEAERLRPSDILERMSPGGETPLAASLLAKVELDVCGAWLTVANVGQARPILVRRAGWVEVRGHPGGSPLADDRIGLGPADMLLLPPITRATGDGAPTDEIFNLSLQAAGTYPGDLVAAVSKADRPRYCAAVGVPADLGSDPIARVAAATGVPAAEVQSPGYPLGDLQPDLWRSPPAPPRVARLRLTRDRASVSTVRSLLDRLLASWRLDNRVDEDDLKLVATELATNAVVHTGSPDTITILYLGDKIRMEVNDGSATVPQARTASVHAEGGRGMRLVDSLSASWGVDSRGGGKQVWCELPVAAGS